VQAEKLAATKSNEQERLEKQIQEIKEKEN
jgi:hypothetical protein